MLHVDGSGLEMTVARLEAQVAAIGSELDALDARSRVLATQWSGDAREAYAHAHKRWEGEFLDLNKLLDGVKEAIRSAHGRYQTAESRVKASWDL